MSNKKIPRRRGPLGRNARLAKIKKIPIKSNIQGHHKGFRKTAASAVFTAPANGLLSGYIKLRDLIGHAKATLTFEKDDNILVDVRDGQNNMSPIPIKGGDTVRVFVKPVEDTATVKEILIGVIFKEIVE